MKMETIKCVDCSTCHITGRDNEILAQQAALTRNESNVPDMVVYDYKYGYFIPISPRPQIPAPRVIGLSLACRRLLRQCRLAGAELLRLDRDGTIHDDLPKFDW